jgi:hypothetical protein
MYLVTYVNAIDPIAEAFDGFLIHGRSVRGAWVEGTLLDPIRLATDLIRYWQPALPGHRIRTDARVPVLTVQGETDVVLLGGGLARQPDGDRLRLWELAGAAHFDSYGIRAGYHDDGSLPPDRLRHKLRPMSSPIGFRTSVPSNSGPQLHYVLQAAVEGLRRWVVDAVPPPSARVLATRRFQPLRLSRDGNGIAIGGVRTPWVSVPVATLSGLGQRTAGLGILLGSTRPWTADALAHRYPDGRSQYLEEFTAATRQTVRAGFLLPDDESEIRSLAAVSWPADQPAEPATRPRSRPDRLTTTRH